MIETVFVNTDQTPIKIDHVCYYVSEKSAATTNQMKCV